MPYKLIHDIKGSNFPVDLKGTGPTDVIFHGKRTQDGCEAFYAGLNGRYTSLPLGLDCVNHSPCGFEFGYDGSGPTQLAFAICFIWAVMNGKAPASEWAFKHYINFRMLTISTWGHEEGDVWELTVGQMMEYEKEIKKMKKYPYVVSKIPASDLWMALGPMTREEAVAKSKYLESYGREDVQVQYGCSIEEIRKAYPANKVIWNMPTKSEAKNG